MFKELAFTSTLKLQDLPEQLPGTKQAKLTANPQGTSITWADTGLTLSDSESSTAVKMAKKPVIKAGIQSENGKYMLMSAPLSVGAEPNKLTTWKADAYAPATRSTETELCDIRLVGFSHPDASKNNLTIPSAYFERSKDSAGDYRQGILHVDWTPTDNHIDLNGQPYTATIKAFVDDKGEGCNGDNIIGTWTETIEMDIPVYVTKGEPNDTVKDKLINFNGGFNVDNKFTYDIRPELFIGASISGGRLKTANLTAKADLSFSNTLTLTSFGAAALSQRVPVLAEKTFTKLFVAGGVHPLWSAVSLKSMPTSSAMSVVKQHWKNCSRLDSRIPSLV